MKTAEQYEAEIASLNARLDEWCAAFETTNVSQAAAEHSAVLKKRAALQAENVELRGAQNRATAVQADNELLIEQLRELKERLHVALTPTPPSGD